MSVIAVIALISLVAFAIVVPVARARARARRPADQPVVTTGRPPAPPAGSDVEQPRRTQ